MYADSFVINLKNYLKRKQQFEQRLKVITGYTENTVGCRSQFIANYFNATIIKACGICDSCINSQTVVVSKQEFEHISVHIFESSSTVKITMQELISKSRHIKREKLWKVFNFLAAEKKLFVNKEGLIILN